MTGIADILFEAQGALGLITLNRSKALNALTLDMIHAMTDQLDEWAEDTDIASVLIQGAGDKAFCAGGDVLALIEPDNAAFIEGFFRDEYRLNRKIFRYPKPYIALIDGIAMGGGVGVSVHGRYRIATERTVFAMPETGIGMFPDVGGTYFLPRLPGAIGLYLGLTGRRLNAADCLYAGLAESFVPLDRHGELLAGLAEGRWPETLTAELGADAGAAPVAEHRVTIDRCFSRDSVEQIMQSLAAEKSDWAAKTLDILEARSPSAMMITFRQIREGAALDFEDCMRLEYRLSQRVVPGHDFREGVRALLVDRDMDPHWAPASLADLADGEIDSYFGPLAHGDLTFPN